MYRLSEKRDPNFKAKLTRWWAIGREGGIWLSIRIFHGWETSHLKRLQDHKFARCCDLWGRSGDGKLETSTSGMEQGGAGLSVFAVGVGVNGTERL
jgi:hypothetical protein